MKKGIKIAIGAILAVIIAVLGVFSPYILSFVVNDDSPKYVYFDNYTYFDAQYGQRGEVMNIRDENYGWFNYYGLEYYSDCYLKAELTYYAGVKKLLKNFFLNHQRTKGCFSHLLMVQ